MSSRAQTSLPALAIALLLLSVVAGLGLAMGDGALAAAERDAEDRRVATSLADRFVAPDAPTTYRRNVLNATAIDRLDGDVLRRSFPVSADAEAVRVRLNGSTAVTTGDPHSGTTIQRLVVVERRTDRSLTPDLGRKRTVTLPRRAGEATLTIAPPSGATVTTVRANDRVVLRDADGLDGTFDVELSRFETTRLSFEGPGSLPSGSVVVEYAPPQTRRATLAVTVDV